MALESGKAISQDILEELNYSNTEEAAREIILLKGRSKIAEYSEKVEKYEKNMI